MSNTIKVKRGIKSNLPTLIAGEFGWCVDTYELYVGDGSTNHLVGGLSNIVEDTTPQLGGNLDLNEKLIELRPSPTSNLTASGFIATMTVDVNAQGIGAPLYMSADGHLETADADADTTMPCVALALETGTGSKKVLMQGFIRNDSWNWSSFGGSAGLIYVSTTTGTLTQAKPSGTGDQVQIVGFATHADRMYFNPQYAMVEIT